MPDRMRRALVFGGTGLVGGEVLKGLASAGVHSVFTWHTNEGKARMLEAELPARGVRVDLSRPEEIRALVAGLERSEELPDIFIHCAARSRAAGLAELTDADWDEVLAVNGRSAFVACQALAPHFARVKGGNVVLVGGLDRTQSAAIPPHFAASQGALSAMAMALAKELGPAGTRVNMVALGLLEGGLSRSISPTLVEDYRSFSALRRLGTPAEAARAILWLALENTYMSGRVVAVNGGL
jgi:3-oxoacyl-[acyl-carrier protein] reductase